MIVVFCPLTSSVVEISIENEGAVFTLEEAEPGLHRLGFPNNPAFGIRRDPSPDEPWEITHQNGQMIARTPMPLPAEVSAWLPEDSATATSALLAHLPSGRYYLVRARPPTEKRDGVLLGNEWVMEAGAHHQVLFYADDIYAGIVGNQNGQPPDLSGPLLGVSVLNYTGDPVPHAALFFCCFAPSEQVAGEVSEVMLVLPRTGPLVFDAMAEYSAEQSVEDKRRWDETHAEAFARKISKDPHLG
jgi:hypothetical protein